MTYSDYIRSSRWRRSAARLGELAASGYRCRACFAAEAEAPLEVHHRTYQRLGHELVGDLTTFCRECHHAVTDALRRRRYALIQPKIVDTVPLFERPAPLFDPTIGFRRHE